VRAFNRLSIQSKLMTMLLAVSIGSIIVIAYQGYRSGRNALSDSIVNQLVSLRSSKAAQIEAYFLSLRSEVIVLGSSLDTVQALPDFTAAYSKVLGESQSIDARRVNGLRQHYRDEFAPRLGKSTSTPPNPDSFLPTSIVSRYLQYEYIVENPNKIDEKQKLDDAEDGTQYSQFHRRYHPIFRRVVEEFGYYDLFLIDTEGNIVYSVKKETDFATNLGIGPYSRTSLALAYKDALRQNNGYVAIADFSFYEPSYGYPAAFMATPIYKGTELIGALAIQLSVDKINAAMTENENWRQDGLGETGETFLVGSDLLMRSDSRSLIEHREDYFKALAEQQVDPQDIRRIEQLNTSVLNQPANSSAVKKALEGQSGIEPIVNYLGEEALSAYSPLNIRGVDWVIVSEINRSEIFAPVVSFARRVMISAAGLVFLITLASMWLARNFIKPINRLTEGFHKLATGHSNVTIDVLAEDELGELGKSFNHMVKKNQKTSELVQKKSQETENLLLNMFPASVASRLKKGDTLITDTADSVTVMFANVQNFQKLTKELKPRKAIEILNEIVTALDEATERHGVEKIKTTGSEYLAVSGLSVPRLDHTKRIMDFAVESIRIVNQVNRERNVDLQMRVGIHTGGVMAGTVGKQRLTYDLWGETVVTAHYVQSNAKPNSIFITEPVCNGLVDLYEFEPAGSITVRTGETISVWQVKI
jgi:class 3 adenylate cyclase